MLDRLPLLSVVLVLLMAGCASSQHKAPVEDRNAPARQATAASAPAAGASAPAEIKLLPGAENAGKPGYYTVKPGDTLIRIGFEHGQNYRDVARWNNIDNPNLIEVGQVVRVVPPGVDAAAVAARGVVAARAEARPLDAKLPAAAASAASAPVAAAASATSPGASAPVVAATPPPPAAPRDGDDDLNWLWPAAGPVSAGFEEGRSKGLAITGKAGDPVLAAADGRVVYAGSGLRGYGNLVIVKHNNTYLTAYAHNQTLLVKEDQVVRRGQKIAEMGASDAERVQLHFEIRRQGKPIDPAKLLPPR
ncbi:peptidoglycan DD-metalloendopeptidase family protein [Aquabacterium sp.]|uniref:peptidoglycan DD-metalloendopeptidase family protein n=1 Tax=Aquabacterium sp. TaxID=1872578 RepID=UPI002BD8EBCF|nr:peptidoglycan DD-metalloendopeptidase family protein [Aquabacterium sp.]HSW06349.1 peptidoglycan DD-metalloendopeptidase family protein [Aquabacterium sp.]